MILVTFTEEHCVYTILVNAGSAPKGKPDMLNYVMSWSSEENDLGMYNPEDPEVIFYLEEGTERKEKVIPAKHLKRTTIINYYTKGKRSNSTS